MKFVYLIAEADGRRDCEDYEIEAEDANSAFEQACKYAESLGSTYFVLGRKVER